MVQFDKIEISDLKKSLCENQTFQSQNIDDAILDLISNSIKSRNNHEVFEAMLEDSTQMDKDGVELVTSISPKIYFKINLELATWNLIGTILDLYLTKGLSLTLLSAIGLSGQFLTKVPLQNGELCNFLKIKDIRATSIKKLSKLLINKKCHHLDFDCKHNIDSLCRITKKAITQNIDYMIEKKILSKKTGANLTINKY